ncbi:MAG: CotH kinase family protein [Bacteroidales bacterium]|nr:CotH kinase family protein [Candidatus Sodaliphilus limicaballi]
MKASYKSYAIIAAALMGCTTAHAQLQLDGRTAVNDSLTATWLFSVPEERFGQDFTATVDYHGLTGLTIDGNEVGETYTFKDVSGTKRWKIAGTDTQGNTVQQDIAFTFLPIVVIDCKVEKDNYNTGTVSVLLPDEDIVSPCKVKFRGGLTNSDKYLKRNYHLKFEDEYGNKTDYKFFNDLRSDNNWLLDAGTIDRLRVRNRILTDLWLDFARKPYYCDIEPKALNASRGKMVEVFRNGEYQGYYNMCEPIDRKQLKLTKTDEDSGELHGMLWKTDTRTTSTLMREVKPFNNSQETWDGFEVKYPDFSDVNPTDYAPLRDLIQFVAESSDEEFAQHAAERLDIPVIIDYIVFLQTIYAYDNLGKNTYWALYDKQESNKFTIAVWDFDTSVGQSWKNYEYHPSYLTPDRDIISSPNLDHSFKRLIMWNVDSIVEKSAARYRELRGNVFDTHNITQRVRNFVKMLDDSGAASREMTRWDQTKDLWGITPDLARETPFVVDWLEKRLNWLDKNYFNERKAGDTNNDGTIDVVDVNAVIMHTMGQPLLPEVYNYQLDVKRDRTIDIADVNAMINKILQTTESSNEK